MGNKSPKSQPFTKSLPKSSNLRALLTHLPFYLTFNLEENYLKAPDFPLTSSGPPLIHLKRPIKLSKLSLYIGETNELTPSGLGSLINQSSFYEGYFKNGQFHGKGRMFTSKNQIISGDWKKSDLKQGEIFDFTKSFKGQIKNLQPNGFGFETSEKLSYRGEFLNSKKHGRGKVIWTDGNWYKGEFVKGKIEGFGKYHWADSTYKGQWKAGKMHGFGVYTYEDGRKYEGSFISGMRDGYGVFIQDNKTYSGYWRAGREDGQGRLEKNGKITEGVWINGKLSEALMTSPRNILTDFGINLGIRVDMQNLKFPKKIRKKCKNVIDVWKNAEKYEWNEFLLVFHDKWIKLADGNFYGESDKVAVPHGKGVFINQYQIYEGEFVLGKKQGFGQCVTVENEVYKGDWRKNKKCGFGNLITKDCVYEGGWRNDKFCGKGVIKTKQFLYDGEWKRGMQHGIGAIVYLDGMGFFGRFVCGEVSEEGIVKHSGFKSIEELWENRGFVKVTEGYLEEERRSESFRGMEETKDALIE